MRTHLQLPPDDLERLAYDRGLPIELDTDGIAHVQVGSVDYWAVAS